MIKLNEMLKCGLCHDRFDTKDRKPLTLSKCGHTFCKECLFHKSVEITLTSCPYKCFPAANSEPVDTVPNFTVITLLDNITELSFNYFKPSFENGLSIDSYCIVHEKATQDYDYIEGRFRCVDCQTSDKNSAISLKTLIKDYLMVIEYMKTMFKINKVLLYNIEKLGTKAEDIRTEVMISTVNKTVEYINNAYRSNNIDSMAYNEFEFIKKKYLQKVEVHLRMLSDLCNDYSNTIRNIEENEKLCAFVSEQGYDLNVLPCTGIYLKPFKPAVYFINKVKGIERYVENQITKFSRKFVLRFLKLYRIGKDEKLDFDNKPIQILKPLNSENHVEDYISKEKDAHADTRMNTIEQEPTDDKTKSKYNLRKRVKHF